MRKFKDITGQRFGKLVAIRPAGMRPQAKRPTSGMMWWHCKCDCGRSTISKGGDLRKSTRSCGCTRTHGHSGLVDGKRRHPLYAIWKTMRQRCNNPACDDYRWYGGRGIRVCKRWDDFTLFLSDMGERPSGFTLERINNARSYSPSNCKWASWEEQHRNKRARTVYRHPRV